MPSPDLQYPIGRFVRVPSLAPAERRAAIRGIASLPSELRAAVRGLGDSQLDTPYRPGGWTVRQVVHHVADSHVNGYIRFRLGLTEELPTIKPYDQDRWSALEDARTAPVELSLVLLDMLHARWARLLESLGPSDFSRMITHPEWEGPLTLDTQLANYRWHGAHHTAQVTALREREGWR